MRIGGLEIRWVRVRAQIVRPGLMSEEEIAAALAVSEKNPQWRAFFQLLEEYTDGARLLIGTDPGNAGLTAWNAGGADILERFGDHLTRKRSEALEAFQQNPARLAGVKVATGMRDGRGRVPGSEN